MIIVLYESSEVVDACLQSLQASTPGRGLEVRVVDNASRDDGAARAAHWVGADQVVRLSENRGFAAGVNAGIAATSGRWVAVLNPDTEIQGPVLESLVRILEADPRAALVAPRVRVEGGFEPTVGRFPTAEREAAHAWFLDRLLGREGRRTTFPARTAPVEWVSGCAWMLRREAIEAVGPLDEGYFMYWEDVDYCRQLHDAGWKVLATPDVEIFHRVSRGSRTSRSLPVDGGGALLRYFSKFHPGEEERQARRALERGWRVRRTLRSIRAMMGDTASARMVERYDLALTQLPRT